MSSIKAIALAKVVGGGGGGGDITVESLTATENKTYTAPSGKAYSPVTVNVPGPTLITKTVTDAGTYAASSDNADGYSSVNVSIANGDEVSY